jgi:hypothetical protein
MTDQMLTLAGTTLLSPVVLFFALGLFAALARSDLAIPEAFAKGLSLFLMMAIGFKGGVALQQHGLSAALAFTALAGIAISFAVPFLAFALLRATSRLDIATAAAVAAHYGSVSVVTYAAATSALHMAGIGYDGAMAAVLAVMETPAILSGLLLARKAGGSHAKAGTLLHEAFLSGAVVLLLGAFAVGLVTGSRGMEMISPLVEKPFQGILCLFLLDMGIVAGRRLLAGAAQLRPALIGFALYMPMIGGTVGTAAAWAIGLGAGDAALFTTLCASASYIAVPAAMRIALPQADAGVYVPLSLAVTFPFNLAIGLPLYIAAGQLIQS